MKKTIYFFIAGLLIFTSCKDDDDEPAAETTTQKISIGGTEYSFEGAGVMDIEYDSDFDEIGKAFGLTNAQISSNKPDITDYNYSIAVQAFTEGTTFKYGTYNESDELNAGLLFTNGDNVYEMENGKLIISQGSTSGAYKIEIDGILENGDTIKGTYSGAFSTQNESFFDGLFELIFG